MGKVGGGRTETGFVFEVEEGSFGDFIYVFEKRGCCQT